LPNFITQMVLVLSQKAQFVKILDFLSLRNINNYFDINRHILLHASYILKYRLLKLYFLFTQSVSAYYSA
jgi:hypothetical protein